jgi:pyruvate formate lyase activating enzyme
MTGNVHSIQSLATLDGPGVRVAIFLQGCNLHCKCCHNPDTIPFDGGTQYTSEEILQKVLSCRDYFGKKGGITFSGGEPLMQADFCREVFEMCHQNGINTCLDTSGCILNDSVKALLEVTDRVLLDIKYSDEVKYRENVGMELKSALDFLDYLEERSIPTTLRRVIIPTMSDDDEGTLHLASLAKSHKCVDKVELLPFCKICQSKYDNMGIEFPFGHLPVPTHQRMEELEQLIK